MLDDSLFEPLDRTEDGDFTESTFRRILDADRTFRLWQRGHASTQSTASLEWGAYLQRGGLHEDEGEDEDDDAARDDEALIDEEAAETDDDEQYALTPMEDMD